MMNGLLTPTSGSIRINGNEVGVETKAHVAYLPDRTYLSGNQKISEVLDFFCDFYEDFDRSKALEMLKSLDIDPDRKMQTYPRAPRRRCS